MRSATTGLRLCGIADEPFWPRPNGSCTSRHLRAREMPDLERERVERGGEHRERREQLRVAVALEDLRRGRGAARARAARTRSARAPDRSPRTCRPRRRACRRACPRARAQPAPRSRSSSNAQPASLRPNVVGSACTPCVRPICSVRRCSSARAVDDGERAVDPVEDQRARGAHLERERRVDDVRGGEPVVEPAALLAEPLGHRVDERGGVVVERRPRSRRPAPASARSRSRAAPRAASAGTTPSSAQAAVAASSTSSQDASLPSSDQILAMAGRE